MSLEFFGTFTDSSHNLISNTASLSLTPHRPLLAVSVPAATVTMQNPVSHYNQTTNTDSQGRFQFVNVPYNNYHLSVSLTGFASAEKDVNVRSPIPVDANVTLQLGTASTSVVVTAEAADLVETNPITHTDVDRGLVPGDPR